MHPPPSRSLPSLVPPPTSPSSLHPHLDYLQDIFLPSDVVVDLTGSTPGMGKPSSPEAELDQFEKQYARQWLERLVMLASKSEGESWSETLDQAASLLSAMAGHSAAGRSTRTYILPAPIVTLPRNQDTISSPALPLSLQIRDTTLLSSSTGHRTWGSSGILSRLITLNPFTFFTSQSSASLPIQPLRILELGAGTGLVGLAVAATLRRMGRSAEVDLTDFEDPVLDNLDFNVQANEPTGEEAKEVKVTVRRLDWSSYLSERRGREGAKVEERYDLIFGADLVYEPLHLPWLHATVSRLLKFPSYDLPPPAFHILVPVRHTHTAELSQFDGAFSPPDASEFKGDEVYGKTFEGDGKRWRLAARHKWEISGEGWDGFGKSENSLVKYKRYQIEWEEVGVDIKG